jgi:Raf kinase inhibitor-like YbhB/YbcL family protein
VPENTKSLSLIMHDPDAVSGDYVHWLIWDINPQTQTISPGSVPVGAVQGLNSDGTNKYIGPCPPVGSGVHRYIFELYALDITLNLPPNTERSKLEEAIKGHVLEKYSLTGLFAADS